MTINNIDKRFISPDVSHKCEKQLKFSVRPSLCEFKMNRGDYRNYVDLAGMLSLIACFANS